jgi:hypothetical protein
MPKLLDVVIGLTVIMLVVSLAVTLLTQFLTSAVNTQGRVLKSGLVNLIAQIDSRFKANVASEIAQAILTHPMIGDPLLGKQRLGSVIHRSELTRLLIEFAVPATEGVSADPSARLLTPQTQTLLQTVLKELGIPDPEATLKRIRTTELALERTHPEMANGLRHDVAILQSTESHLVAKINAWFDQTIDRVSSVFTAHVRIITFAAAVLVAILLQLDTVGMVNGLWIDDALRKEIVDQGIQFAKEYKQPSSTIPGDQAATDANSGHGVDTNRPPLNDADLSRLQYNQAAKYLSVLSQYQVLAFPALNGRQWLEHWSVSELPGIALSALLLSMGAPFWYSILQTLLRLRSQIAESDDQQRNFRKENERSIAATSAQEPDR